MIEDHTVAYRILSLIEMTCHHSPTPTLTTVHCPLSPLPPQVDIAFIVQKNVSKKFSKTVGKLKMHHYVFNEIGTNGKCNFTRFFSCHRTVQEKYVMGLKNKTEIDCEIYCR